MSRGNAYLASVIQQTQPEDNAIRTGTVVSIDGLTLTVSVNGGNVPCGFLSTWTPVVGQTVALLRQGADWFCLGPTAGPASPPETTVTTGSGASIVGEAYFSGGTTASAAGGLENIMTTWTGGGTFTFENGVLYRYNFAFGFYDTAGTAHMCEMRLRKGFTTGGLQLAQFRRATVPGFASIVQMGFHQGYIKNASGGQVVTAVGASIQRASGTGTVAYYGDATFHMTLSLEQVGPVTSYPVLSAIATEIN